MKVISVKQSGTCESWLKFKYQKGIVALNIYNAKTFMLVGIISPFSQNDTNSLKKDKNRKKKKGEDMRNSKKKLFLFGVV